MVLLSISAIFSTLALIGNSEAQPPTSNHLLSDTEIFIFVQTIVKNSDGQLVTYLTSDKFSELDLDKLQTLLKNEDSEGDPIVTIDGQEFRVTQRLQKLQSLEENVIASTLIALKQNDDLIQVARFAHDGYPIVEGDEVFSVWTFIRPVD